MLAKAVMRLRIFTTRKCNMKKCLFTVYSKRFESRQLKNVQSNEDTLVAKIFIFLSSTTLSHKFSKIAFSSLKSHLLQIRMTHAQTKELRAKVY
jgi:hypothetical protein